MARLYGWVIFLRTLSVILLEWFFSNECEILIFSVGYRSAIKYQKEQALRAKRREAEYVKRVEMPELEKKKKLLAGGSHL